MWSGKARSSQRGQHLGMDLIEATLLADGLTQIIEGSGPPGAPDSRRRNPRIRFRVSIRTRCGDIRNCDGSTAASRMEVGGADVSIASVRRHVTSGRRSSLGQRRHRRRALGIIVGRSVTWHGRNFYASPMLLPKGYGIDDQCAAVAELVR